MKTNHLESREFIDLMQCYRIADMMDQKNVIKRFEAVKTFIKTHFTPNEEGIEFTRINNDVNGNPRYVCHFLHFLHFIHPSESGPRSYEIAIKRANKIGGRKFHNKQYGGGIVFQSYNLQETEGAINKLMAE